MEKYMFNRSIRSWKRSKGNEINENIHKKDCEVKNSLP